jgi:hypothetical protein
MSECQLDKEPFKQCCCKCRFHLADHYHCSFDKPHLKAIGIDTEGCICKHVRGWICAPPEFQGRAHSNWPEHDVGCEMFTLVSQPQTAADSGIDRTGP